MKQITKTVTFTESVSVIDHNGAVTFEAKAGETMDLAAASANRWLRRKKAVDGDAIQAKKPETKAPEKPEVMQRQPPITATQTQKPAAKKSATKQKAATKKQAD